MYPFSSVQLILLIPGILSLLWAVVQFHRGNDAMARFFLLAGGALLWSLSASLDTFLNPWDERFHALVARNMTTDFFAPYLYDQEYPGTDPLNWSKAHIWLHKQPLFLWQIAVSYLMFGISEFTTRLPSILMLVVMLHALYRTAFILLNARVAFISGFLFVTCHYLHALVSGRLGMDHNDIAFMSYITLSIWAWLEYTTTGKTRWALVAGLFSGAAIMCKWLAGLAVFLPWGIWVLMQKNVTTRYSRLFLALAVTTLTFLPWMQYTLIRFPLIADFELNYHHKHFSETVEGHGGTFTYHFEQFPELYGPILALLAIPGMILLFKRSNQKIQAGGLLALAGFIYLFFSIAETKLPGYTLPAAVVIFIAAACVIDSLLSRIKRQWSAPALFIVLALTAWVSLDAEKLLKDHDPTENAFTRVQISNKTAFLKLGEQIPEDALLFNLPGRSYIDLMFYTPITAFGFLPDSAQIAAFKNYGRPMYVLNPPQDMKFKLEQAGLQLVKADLVLNE